MTKSTKWVASLLVLILSVGSILTLSAIFHNGNHSFKQKSEWTNLKLMGRTGLMGTVEFAGQRQSLALNQLNLGEWHGHNEAIWHQRGPWHELSFNFQIHKNGYLWVFFSQSPERKHGFRLSRRDDFPSGFFTVDPNGKYLERVPLSVSLRKGKNKFKIQVGSNGLNAILNDVTVFDSGSQLKDPSLKDIKLGDANFMKDQLISFRSSLFPAMVDDVVLRGPEVSVTEDFSPDFHWGFLRTATVIYGLILLSMILISFIFAARAKAPLILVSAQGLILFFLIGFFIIDKWIWAKGYYYSPARPFNREMAKGSMAQLEVEREKLFQKISKWSGIEIKQVGGRSPEFLARVFKHPDDKSYQFWPSFQFITASGEVTLHRTISEVQAKPKDGLKLAFMGTSQTWGAGAQGMRETFVAKTVLGLNRTLNKKIHGFNFSICGSQFEELFKTYKEVLMTWKPDILVVNLSNNDSGDADKFENNLRKLLETNKTENVKTVFILEANDIEIKHAPINDNHKRMEKVGAEYEIPVLKLHAYLNSKEVYDSGHIWMDVVHFDQYGHNITADWLTKELVLLLKSRQ